MPLPIAHGFVGAAAVAAIHPKISKLVSVPLLVGGFLANCADLDFILAFSTGDKSWHRGFSHSILFAVIVFIIFALYLGRERIRESAAFGAAYFSHLVLDYSTSGGGGPALFWFFTDERFSIGVKTFSVVPSRLPVSDIIYHLAIEAIVFGSLYLIVYFVRTKFSQVPE